MYVSVATYFDCARVKKKNKDKMQKKIMCFVLTLTVAHLAESWPRDTKDFDNLNMEYSDRALDDEEQPTNFFSKLLTVGEVVNKPILIKIDKAKVVSAKINGSKKKTNEKKGEKTKYRAGDVSSFYKVGDLNDRGVYDDSDVYALASAIAATAGTVKANENRTYKKGNKTRGFHRVHHKDEYKKEQEFYEDDETKGSINKNAIAGAGKALEAKARLNKGAFNRDYHKGIYGKEGFLDNGFSDKESLSFDDSQGLDTSFSNELL